MLSTYFAIWVNRVEWIWIMGEVCIRFDNLLIVSHCCRDALIASVLDGVRASGNRDICVKMKPTKRGYRLGKMLFWFHFHFNLTRKEKKISTINRFVCFDWGIVNWFCHLNSCSLWLSSNVWAVMVMSLWLKYGGRLKKAT